MTKMRKQKKKQVSTKVSTAADKLIYTDLKIELPNEVLRSMLSHVYEKACSDASTFKFSRYYSGFFTFSASLIIALITSDFRDFFLFSAEEVKKSVLGLSIGSSLMGLILCIKYHATKQSGFHEKRDKTVEEALKNMKRKCE